MGAGVRGAGVQAGQPEPEALGACLGRRLPVSTAPASCPLLSVVCGITAGPKFSNKWALPESPGQIWHKEVCCDKCSSKEVAFTFAWK